jgi:hypothetical protein
MDQFVYVRQVAAGYYIISVLIILFYLSVHDAVIAAAAGATADLPAALTLQQQHAQPKQVPSRYTPLASSSSSSSVCTAAARPVLEALDKAFSQTAASNAARGGSSSSSRPSGSSSTTSSSIAFTSQSGYIDFGLTNSDSTSGSASAACSPSCAFTNPTSTYGLTVLPLHPQEDLEVGKFEFE